MVWLYGRFLPWSGSATNQHSACPRERGEGPPSMGKFCLRCSIFFFSSLFSLDSAHLIKAEIQDFKDVQISLPSSLTKPWPSWCFKKHMEGLRFHVSHKMCWFHKYQKVKRDLPAVFTFLQCLQKKGRIRCEKVCIQQC